MKYKKGDVYDIKLKSGRVVQATFDEYERIFSLRHYYFTATKPLNRKGTTFVAVIDGREPMNEWEGVVISPAGAEVQA